MHYARVTSVFWYPFKTTTSGSIWRVSGRQPEYPFRRTVSLYSWRGGHRNVDHASPVNRVTFHQTSFLVHLFAPINNGLWFAQRSCIIGNYESTVVSAFYSYYYRSHCTALYSRVTRDFPKVADRCGFPVTEPCARGGTRIFYARGKC
jgi:hypothetical protein